MMYRIINGGPVAGYAHTFVVKKHFFLTLMLVPALYAIGLDITAFRARVRQRMRSIWSPKSAGEDLAAAG